jgi:DNA-binding response OmpR family regulator
MTPAVLLVEDDIDLGNLLKQYLELNGFSVVLSADGKCAKDRLLETTFDIVLTDVMMPLEDGFSLAAYLTQSYPQIPFLFITARKMKEDVIMGLQLGADDYIIKPFDAKELTLRIRNILRRTSAEKPNAERLTIGQYTFFPKNLLLEGPGGRQELTEREAELLQLLVENRNQLVRKRDILNRLWKESDFFTSRSMDVFVSRLRKYLSGDPAIVLESVRGAGLRLFIN